MRPHIQYRRESLIIYPFEKVGRGGKEAHQCSSQYKVSNDLLTVASPGALLEDLHPLSLLLVALGVDEETATSVVVNLHAMLRHLLWLREVGNLGT